MFTRLASLAQKTLPIEFRLVAVSVAIGLLSGAFYLGESPDLATAVGIAVGFSCAVGNWIGIRLYLVAARLFITWIDTIRKRVDALESRMALAERSGDTGGRKNPQRPFATHLIIISVYATPACFVMATTGAIGSILSTQLGSLFVAALLAATLSGLCASILVVAIQSLYLWRLQRRVASFERMLDRVDAVSPITLKAQVLNHNISRAERTVRRLTGAGKPIAGHTA